MNMDWIYCSAVQHMSEVDRMTMYDIVCQWALYFEQRAAELPEELR